MKNSSLCFVSLVCVLFCVSCVPNNGGGQKTEAGEPANNRLLGMTVITDTRFCTQYLYGPSGHSITPRLDRDGKIAYAVDCIPEEPHK